METERIFNKAKSSWKHEYKYYWNSINYLSEELVNKLQVPTTNLNIKSMSAENISKQRHLHDSWVNVTERTRTFIRSKTINSHHFKNYLRNIFVATATTMSINKF